MSIDCFLQLGHQGYDIAYHKSPRPLPYDNDTDDYPIAEFYNEYLRNPFVSGLGILTVVGQHNGLLAQREDAPGIFVYSPSSPNTGKDCHTITNDSA